MGVGRDDNGLQMNRKKEETKVIHTRSNQQQQYVNDAALPQVEGQKEENGWSLEELLEQEGEVVDRIDPLMQHQEPGEEILPVNGLDERVEKRRAGVLSGEKMDTAERQKYILEYDHWQEERNANRSQINNYSQELEASNAKLLQLTNLLEGDTRSASESFEDVRCAMRVLTNLCKREREQSTEKMTEEFGMEYETAYQNAVDAVNAYLASHASWRWSSQGRERKRWMNDLRGALEQHKKYAAQIISGYSAISEFRDAFEKGHALEMIDHEMELLDQQQSVTEKEEMEQLLKNGTPRQVIKVLLDNCCMQRYAEVWKLDHGNELTEWSDALIQKIITSPFAEQVEYARTLLCMQAGVKKRIRELQNQAMSEVPPVEELSGDHMLDDSFVKADEEDLVKSYVELRVQASGLTLQYAGVLELLERLNEKVGTQPFGALMETVMQEEWSGRKSIWDAEGMDEIKADVTISGYDDEDVEHVSEKLERSYLERHVWEVRSKIGKQHLTEVVPHDITSMKEYYQQMKEDGFDKLNGTHTLTDLMGSFLAENHMMPTNRTDYISKFWAIKRSLEAFLEKANRYITMLYEDREQYQSDRQVMIYATEQADKRVALCEELLQTMEHMKAEMRQNHMMWPAEDLDELDEKMSKISYETVFLPEDTQIPIEIQCCGDAQKLLDYGEEHQEELSDIEKEYLLYRIRVCQHIENVKYTNVIPEECSVYQGSYKVPHGSDEEIDIEKDKFIFDNLVQIHAQKYENTSWAAVMETLLRQRGIFVDQFVLLGFRSSTMADKGENNALKDSATLKALRGEAEEIDVRKAGGLVGRTTKNTVLALRQISGKTIQDISGQFKKWVLNAMRRDRSGVGIRYEGHYVTIAGIDGDTVYYKNPCTTQEPNTTWSKGIREFLGKAVSTVEKDDNILNNELAINMFWLKETPDSDIAD